MAKFVVSIREVHVSLIMVEAATHDDAVAKVFEGEGEEVSIEYSHTLDKSTWSVSSTDESRQFYYNEVTGKFDKEIK